MAAPLSVHVFWCNNLFNGPLSVWPDWVIYWTLGNFLKPLATIHLPKSPIFLGNFCKGVKIVHFSSEIIFGNFYRHLLIFSGHSDLFIVYFRSFQKKHFNFYNITNNMINVLPVSGDGIWTHDLSNASLLLLLLLLNLETQNVLPSVRQNISVVANWINPRPLYCLFSFFSNTTLHKNCHLEKDSNWDWSE